MIAITEAIPPLKGPKKSVHKLITIDLPSKIIPVVSMNGFIIPMIEVIPNKSPWKIFPGVDFLSHLLSINPEIILNEIKIERL